MCIAVCASCGEQVRAAVRVVQTTCKRPLGGIPLILVGACEGTLQSSKAQRRTAKGEVN